MYLLLDYYGYKIWYLWIFVVVVKTSKDDLKAIEGMKAFFASDPSRASSDMRELKELDKDMSGDIDAGELRAVRNRKMIVSRSNKMMEMLSTHPNMLKRIHALSEME